MQFPSHSHVDRTGSQHVAAARAPLAGAAAPAPAAAMPAEPPVPLQQADTRATEQLLRSVRKMLALQPGSLLARPDCESLPPGRRVLVKAGGGLLYRDREEILAQAGGLYVPVDPRKPVRCADPQKLDGWLREIEVILSMQPPATELNIMLADLRERIFAAGSDYDAFLQAVNEVQASPQARALALTEDTWPGLLSLEAARAQTERSTRESMQFSNHLARLFHAQCTD